MWWRRYTSRLAIGLPQRISPIDQRRIWVSEGESPSHRYFYMLVIISKILLIINIAMILFSILIGEIAGMFVFALFGMLNIITIHFDRVLEDIMQVMNKAYEWVIRKK